MNCLQHSWKILTLMQRSHIHIISFASSECARRERVITRSTHSSSRIHMHVRVYVQPGTKVTARDESHGTSAFRVGPGAKACNSRRGPAAPAGCFLVAVKNAAKHKEINLGKAHARPSDPATLFQIVANCGKALRAKRKWQHANQEEIAQTR